jgi:hypothetical protein
MCTGLTWLKNGSSGGLNFRVPENAEVFQTSWGTISFSRRTLLFKLIGYVGMWHFVLLRYRPTPQQQDHPFSTVHECSLSTFPSTCTYCKVGLNTFTFVLVIIRHRRVVQRAACVWARTVSLVIWVDGAVCGAWVLHCHSLGDVLWGGEDKQQQQPRGRSSSEKETVGWDLLMCH